MGVCRHKTVLKFDTAVHHVPSQRRTQGHGVLSSNGCMTVHNNNIIVSGEVILSAENTEKPLGGRGSARIPLGSSQRSPDLLVGGEGVAAPPQEPHPALDQSAFGLAPSPNGCMTVHNNNIIVSGEAIPSADQNKLVENL